MEDSLKETIKSNWSLFTGGLFDKFTGLQEAISVWERSVKRRRKGIKEALSSDLEDLLEANVLEKLIHTKFHLNLEIEKEETFWEQHARVNWLKEGDRNRTFFISMPLNVTVPIKSKL